MISAPVDVVWKTINESEVWRRCTPGLQMLKEIAPDTYEASLNIRVAAVEGTYVGTLRITDKQPPCRYRLLVEGSGAAGFAKGEGLVDFEARGGDTVIKWSGDIQVGGDIAKVSERMSGEVAKVLIGQFFDCLEQHAISEEPVAARADERSRLEGHGRTLESLKERLVGSLDKAIAAADVIDDVDVRTWSPTHREAAVDAVKKIIKTVGESAEPLERAAEEAWTEADMAVDEAEKSRTDWARRVHRASSKPSQEPVGTELGRREPMSAAKRWLIAFSVSTFGVGLWVGLTHAGYLNWSPVTRGMNAIDESAGWLGTLAVLFVVWVALAVAAARAMRSDT